MGWGNRIIPSFARRCQPSIICDIARRGQPIPPACRFSSEIACEQALDFFASEVGPYGENGCLKSGFNPPTLPSTAASPTRMILIQLMGLRDCFCGDTVHVINGMEYLTVAIYRGNLPCEYSGSPSKDLQKKKVPVYYP